MFFTLLNEADDDVNMLEIESSIGLRPLWFELFDRLYEILSEFSSWLEIKVELLLLGALF